MKTSSRTNSKPDRKRASKSLPDDEAKPVKSQEKGAKRPERIKFSIEDCMRKAFFRQNGIRNLDFSARSK